MKVVGDAPVAPGTKADETLHPAERTAKVAAQIVALLIEQTLSVSESYTALRSAGRLTKVMCAAIIAKDLGCAEDDPRVVERLEFAVKLSAELLEKWGSVEIALDPETAQRFVRNGSAGQN